MSFFKTTKLSFGFDFRGSLFSGTFLSDGSNVIKFYAFFEGKEYPDEESLKALNITSEEKLFIDEKINKFLNR